MQTMIINQGLPKKRPLIKSKLLRQQLLKHMNINVLGLTNPCNAFYGVAEMQMYFFALITEQGSGNLVKDIVFDKYRFNLPDPQTVKDRCEKLPLLQIEDEINVNFLKFAHTLPQSRYRLEKTKQVTTQRRRFVGSRSSKRKRQRESFIDAPKGRYLSIDFTLKPFYTKRYDQYVTNEHPLGAHLTKNRSKQSTSKFLGYHTIYDYELGSRQILGLHMLTKYRDPSNKDGWKREELGNVIKRLLDPILSQISVKGVVCDGDYFMNGVIEYLENQKLDYVIRASSTPLIKDLKEMLQLNDGQGYEHPSGYQMTKDKKTLNMRLVIAKRGQELVPFVLPLYSELTPEQALLVFEERFAIESSYREIYKYLPNTCSLSPQYRLVLYAMTVWFYNLLLNHYEMVVIFAENRSTWHTSLAHLHSCIQRLLGDLMCQAAE